MAGSPGNPIRYVIALCRAVAIAGVGG
jgi:hypothetical protein